MEYNIEQESLRPAYVFRNRPGGEVLLKPHSDVSQQRYEQSITGLFNTMHAELVRAKAIALSTEENRVFNFAQFDAAYHAIGYLSYELYNEMTRQIQNGNVGTFSTKPVEDLAPTYAVPSPIPAQY